MINPYADQLTFLDDKTRTRRDHEKYLTLIDSIALLHQFQREIKSVQSGDKQIDYVEVAVEDIDTTNRLAHDILGRTLDELPPQTRKLLTLITDWLHTECQRQSIEQHHFRFSRRQVRQLCGWSETQVRVHMQRLVAMEYLLTHRGGRGQSFEYELLYSGEGDQGDAFLMRLLDVEALKNSARMPASRGKASEFVGSSRPQRGGIAESPKTRQPLTGKACEESSRSGAESASRPLQKHRASHRADTPPLAAKAAPTTEV